MNSQTQEKLATRRGETTRLTSRIESSDNEIKGSMVYIKGVGATILKLGET